MYEFEEDMDLIQPLYYRMSPETETVILSRKLKDGMVVMLEDPESRIEAWADDDEMDTDWVNRDMNVLSRWCRVTDLTPTLHGMAFVGVYADGFMAARLASPAEGWIVKKDSITEETE